MYSITNSLKAEFFVWLDDQRMGPFTKEQLKDKLAQGIVSADSMIWKEGMPDWAAFSLIPELGLTSAPVNLSRTDASEHQIKDELLELSCKNCGGNLDYCSGDEIATCPFCGSSHILRKAVSSVERLRDLENASLPVSHFRPQILPDDAIPIIVKAIRNVQAGYKDPEGLSMTVEGAYFPAWRIGAKVQCTWHGEYSVTNTVTKYREVAKTVNGKTQYLKEPYDAKETVWHPTSGSHVFSTILYTPAVPGFSQHQLNNNIPDASSVKVQGHPQVQPGLAVAAPKLSQSQVWAEFDCDSRIDKEAYDKCEDCVQRLKTVSAVPTSKDFALVYLPIGVVAYTANGSPFRHFVNLRTGKFSGDLPLDDDEIRKECVKAAQTQRAKDRTKWLVWTGACVLLAWVSAHFITGESALLISRWYYWAGFGIVLWICFPKKSPWDEFLWERRAYLFRTLAHPPPDLEAAMHAGEDAVRLQESVIKMAAKNELEDVSREKSYSVLSHPANILLRAASPSAMAGRTPAPVKILFSLGLAALALYLTQSELELDAINRRAISKLSASLNSRSESSSGLDTEYKGKSGASSSAKGSRTEPRQPSEADVPTKINYVAQETSSNNEHRISAQAEQLAAQRIIVDARLSAARERLTSVNSTIESERARWAAALKLINELTNNKQTPVPQGSQAYFRCAEASKVIKEVELKAPEIKAEKARLEATISELQK